MEGKIKEEIQKREAKQTDEINYLRLKVEALDMQVRMLKLKLEVHEKHEAPEDVIEIRDIPIEKIKEEMLSLLSDGKTRYADEIADELKLDIKSVIEAFSQLQKEGKLFVDKDKL